MLSLAASFSDKHLSEHATAVTHIPQEPEAPRDHGEVAVGLLLHLGTGGIIGTCNFR